VPRPARPAGHGQFPAGAAITRTDLETDPHPWLATLRRHEPVSWLPALNGWLVTRRDLAVAVMRDSGTFTVDDPRFSTARVVGPSMLSLDGPRHARHRAPFSPGFSRNAITAQLSEFVTARAQLLVDRVRPDGFADLRTALAGPLAVDVVAQSLGIGDADPAVVLSWYLAIVGAVSALTGDQQHGPAGGGQATAIAAGHEAFGALRASLLPVLGGGPHSLLAQAAGAHAGGDANGGGGLSGDEVISNAAVLMFGGIETTEGMITNALLYLLSDPDQRRMAERDPGLIPGAIEESLRLEPAASLVDRYATRDVEIGGAAIAKGDLVSVSLAGAGRDPAVFTGPDSFDPRRANARLHLAFAHGPHFCLGAHLARLEAAAAVRAAFTLPGLRLDPGYHSSPRGLVFRKPPSLHVRWDNAAS
jgi:cytochrome P450